MKIEKKEEVERTRLQKGEVSLFDTGSHQNMHIGLGKFFISLINSEIWLRNFEFHTRPGVLYRLKGGEGED